MSKREIYQQPLLVDPYPKDSDPQDEIVTDPKPSLKSFSKRYSKIDQHSARHFKYNVACLSSPSPFLSSQIITPFSNSMIFTYQETGL